MRLGLPLLVAKWGRMTYSPLLGFDSGSLVPLLVMVGGSAGLLALRSRAGNRSSFYPQAPTGDGRCSFIVQDGSWRWEVHGVEFCGISKFWHLLPVRGEEVASLAAVFSVGSGRRGRRKLGRCLKDLSVISCFLEDLLVIGDFTVL